MAILKTPRNILLHCWTPSFVDLSYSLLLWSSTQETWSTGTILVGNRKDLQQLKVACTQIAGFTIHNNVITPRMISPTLAQLPLTALALQLYPAAQFSGRHPPPPLPMVPEHFSRCHLRSFHGHTPRQLKSRLERPCIQKRHGKHVDAYAER